MNFRTVLMILHEITQHNFETADCSSLEDYFALCEQNPLEYYRGISMKGDFWKGVLCEVKRKPIDMRLSSVFRGSHVSGSSETFYGNVLSRAVPPVVESDGQRGSESLATHHSPSPGNDLRIDLQDNTDSCLRLYRRMSGFMGSPLEEEGEEEYGAMDSPNEESSFCENNEIEEIVDVFDCCHLGCVLWEFCYK